MHSFNYSSFLLSFVLYASKSKFVYMMTIINLSKYIVSEYQKHKKRYTIYIPMLLMLTWFWKKKMFWSFFCFPIDLLMCVFVNFGVLLIHSNNWIRTYKKKIKKKPKKHWERISYSNRRNSATLSKYKILSEQIRQERYSTYIMYN